MKVVDVVVGLRVETEEEVQGLKVTEHSALQALLSDLGSQAFYEGSLALMIDRGGTVKEEDYEKNRSDNQTVQTR